VVAISISETLPRLLPTTVSSRLLIALRYFLSGVRHRSFCAWSGVGWLIRVASAAGVEIEVAALFRRWRAGQLRAPGDGGVRVAGKLVETKFTDRS
jgi:hypothetical protein